MLKPSAFTSCLYSSIMQGTLIESRELLCIHSFGTCKINFILHRSLQIYQENMEMWYLSEARHNISLWALQRQASTAVSMNAVAHQMLKAANEFKREKIKLSSTKNS